MNIQKIILAYDTLVAFSNLEVGSKFKLDGVVRMKLAVNIANLGKLVDVFQKERNALIFKLGTPVDGKPGAMEVKEDSKKHVEFSKIIAEMLAYDHDVKLEPITKKDILGKDKTNQVPVGILSDLITLGILND